MTEERRQKPVAEPCGVSASDQNVTAHEQPPQSLIQEGRSKRLLLRLFVLVLAAAIIVLFTMRWNHWVGSRTSQTTDDAYLQSDLTPLAAKVNGYVRRIGVTDFQDVRAGDLLVQIEDDDYRAQVNQAEANVQAAAAAITNIEKQEALQQTLIRQAKAEIAATRSDVWRSGRDVERERVLVAAKAVSTQVAEQAMNAYQRAQATLDLNDAQLDQQAKQLGVLETQKTQAEATLKAQQAALDIARINFGYTRITAPVDGMVGQRQVQLGQYVTSGTQIISIVPLPKIWVIANYKETQMTRVKIGQPVTVTVDAFPDVVLHGRVEGWSPATGSQFSLLPADNATGNFTKVVQRIPVKITVDVSGENMRLLRPGMSVVATIDTTDTSKQ